MRGHESPPPRPSLSGVVACTKNSFIDFPTTLAAVLFYRGCNLRCPYCHNPGIVLAEATAELSSDELWHFFEKRRDVLQGVVLSGGEPTLHPEIAGQTAALRALGYRIKLDTNGLLPEMIDRIAPEYLALDLKTTPQRYASLLGARYSDVEQRLEQAVQAVRTRGINAEVRITLCPSIVDRSVCEYLAGMAQGVSVVYLQPMNRFAPVLDAHRAGEPDAFSPGEIEGLQTLFLKRGVDCRIRGHEQL